MNQQPYPYPQQPPPQKQPRRPKSKTARTLIIGIMILVIVVLLCVVWRVVWLTNQPSDDDVFITDIDYDGDDQVSFTIHNRANIDAKVTYEVVLKDEYNTARVMKSTVVNTKTSKEVSEHLDDFNKHYGTYQYTVVIVNIEWLD